MERTLKSRLHSDRGNRNAHVRAASINHLDRLAINYRDHAHRQVREADGFPDMRISKSGKPAVSLTCESASPGSTCFQKNLDANPEKSGFCGKPSTPAHVRFFPKPFISFASAQLRLCWHSPCAIGAVR